MISINESSIYNYFFFHILLVEAFMQKKLRIRIYLGTQNNRFPLEICKLNSRIAHVPISTTNQNM